MILGSAVDLRTANLLVNAKNIRSRREDSAAIFTARRYNSAAHAMPILPVRRPTTTLFIGSNCLYFS